MRSTLSLFWLRSPSLAVREEEILFHHVVSVTLETQQVKRLHDQAHWSNISSLPDESCYVDLWHHVQLCLIQSACLVNVGLMLIFDSGIRYQFVTTFSCILYA